VSRGGPAAPIAGAIHLWPFDLDADQPPADPLTLATDERARASRFRFERDARRFVRGRAVLREVLGRYCECGASDIVLVTNEQGKPALADASERGLWFNLAHSDHQALLAVGAQELLGVDVEFVRPGFADDEIAERFFAPSEVERLRALPLAQQADAFFRCWTRKEAYIKARGGGLQIPLDSFTVGFEPDEHAALTWVAGAPAEAAQWSLRDVSDAVPGCVAALAVRLASDRFEVPAVFDLYG
jgi:4'-phosphopantetheinyl transferase